MPLPSRHNLKSTSARVTIICHVMSSQQLVSFSFQGTSKYKIAFEKACELFKASISEKDSKTKKKVILFLTDGDPSDTNRSLIFKTIRDCNTELKNSIIIFTYGIGNAVNQEILKDIANLNTAKYGYPANRTVGDITVKSYMCVMDSCAN